ncbi:beta-2-microglobulin-like [Sebastes umbrosus]|uniref:beta-2-microglobulin-like n=1 Tax=Sebastes umbrosus TaxID=72105 RepID=UPI00189E3B91|nr:beta-2-microglobulin-like [Sebastes umbrosus]XP_037619062.1 beta-2-microglobulin-like [Sebastes umbrosus]
MKTFIILVILAVIGCSSSAKDSSAKVQVYSREPGTIGKANTFICHVSGFHPPEITIQLLRNGREMSGSEQTDLAFEENWHYHLTRHVAFTPNKEDRFACNVTHLGKSNIHSWEPDM